MAFPKKNTRNLIVDGREFHWHTETDSAVDHGAARATIRAVSGGPILHYCMLEFPSAAEAAEMIRFAQEHGWEDRKPGSVLWVLYDDEGHRCVHAGQLDPERARQANRDPRR